MIEIRKKHLDKGDKIVVILMDLSKAFDTINHSLLLAILDTYSLSRISKNYAKLLMQQAAKKFYKWLIERLDRRFHSGSASV